VIKGDPKLVERCDLVSRVAQLRNRPPIHSSWPKLLMERRAFSALTARWRIFEGRGRRARISAIWRRLGTSANRAS